MDSTGFGFEKLGNRELFCVEELGILLFGLLAATSVLERGTVAEAGVGVVGDGVGPLSLQVSESSTTSRRRRGVGEWWVTTGVHWEFQPAEHASYYNSSRGWCQLLWTSTKRVRGVGN